MVRPYGVECQLQKAWSPDVRGQWWGVKLALGEEFGFDDSKAKIRKGSFAISYATNASVYFE
jgi:hypothetical protein